MTALPSSGHNPQSAGKTGNGPAWNAILALALVTGIVLRLVLRSSASLWEDEIIATTHAVQPFIGLMTNVILNDVHPPLYFIELHLWSCFSHSDVWFIANSVFFSLIALASMFTVVRRLTDTPRAVAAASVLAVLPSALWMAEEVRMYAMLSVFLIWMFYFTTRAFASPGRAMGGRAAMVLLGLAIVYAHAIGFVAVLFYGLYAASWLLTRRAGLRDWLAWLFVFGIVGVMAVPLLVGGMMHKADMPPLTGLRDIIAWIASVVTGEGYRYVPWLQTAGAIIYLLIVVPGTLFRPTRRMTLCFLVTPLLLCIVVGVTVKPIFKTNFFSTFFSPFLSMVLASMLVSMPLKRMVRATVLSCVLIGLLAMGVANRLALNAANGYFHQIADIIVAGKQPGDVVWTPQMSMFWGMAWYLSGPDWGSPVSIAAPFRPQSGWWKVFNWLGPDLVQELKLIPTGQSVMTRDGMPLVIGIESRPLAEQAKRVWLVTYAPRNDIPGDLPGGNLGPLHRVKSVSFSSIQLNLYAQSQ